MQLSSRIQIQPAIRLCYAGAAIALAFAGTAVFMGNPVDPALIATTCGIVFGVYGINRFTDIEDLINTPDARLFFQQNGYLLPLSIAAMGSSLLLLMAVSKLTVFHLLSVLTGIAYSVRVIPVITRKRTIRFTRLKDLTFVKSLSVALLLGSGIYLLNLSVYGWDSPRYLELLAIMISTILMIFVNTNFCDILDIQGDRASGVPTIPAVYGERATLIYVAGVPSVVWFSMFGIGFLHGIVSTPMAVVLSINVLYPLVYILPYLKHLARPHRLKSVAELDAVLLVLELLMLRVIDPLS